MDLLGSELVAVLRPGSVVVNHGTGTPANAVTMADTCATARLEFLDAPVSGGHDGAVARKLTTMVGGPPAAADRCDPIFRTFSTHVAHLGGHGAGQLAKVLNNALMMMNHASVADILELAVQLRLDPAALAEVIKTGSGSSAALELLPTGLAAPPDDVVKHATDVLLVDASLFDAAMTERQINVAAITARAVSGANRLPSSLAALNHDPHPRAAGSPALGDRPLTSAEQPPDTDDARKESRPS
jgi:3-hydroxyisobutyrate dehydrogenase-like beta-hydroxyacid dehydrogenase